MKWRFAALLILCGAAGMARALPPGSVGVELVSDERRRGISWSDGKPSASAWVQIPAGALALEAEVSALRDSPRFGATNAVIDAIARYRVDRGAWRFDLGGVVHAFAGGRGPLDYGELTAETGALIGPANLSIYADYAPRQKAIGGDNLHVGAAASVALVGTPFTLDGRIGRSSGYVTRPDRAARVRPDGNYMHWQAGVTATRGMFSLGTSLSGTSGTGDARHAGERLIVRLGARF